MSLSFLKSLSIYTFSNIINSGVTFLLLPFLTAYFTPEEYGIYSMFLILILVAFNFISISSFSAIQIEYYDLEKKEFAIYVSSSLLLNILIFLFFLLATVCFDTTLSSLFNIPPRLLWVTVILGFFQTVLQVVLVVFQASNNPLYYGILNSGLVILNIALSLLAVIAFGMKWDGMLWALLISYAVVFIVCIITLLRLNLLTNKFKLKYIITTLKYGLPLLPHVFSGLCIELGSRFFVAKMVSISEMGIFNVGAQIAKAIAIVEISFNKALVPLMFSNLKKGTLEGKIKVIKVSLLFFLALLGALIILVTGSPLIFKYFIGSEFSQAILYTNILALGYFFSGVYKIFVNYIFYVKKTIWLSYLSFLNILISILLNYYMTGLYGAAGAAYASLIVYAILLICTIIISNHLYKMPWKIGIASFIRQLKNYKWLK